MLNASGLNAMLFFVAVDVSVLDDNNDLRMYVNMCARFLC